MTTYHPHFKLVGSELVTPQPRAYPSYYNNKLLSALPRARHRSFKEDVKGCAELVHFGKRKKHESGKFVTHPLFVGSRQRGEDAYAVGVLHDVIEDLLADCIKTMEENPHKQKLFTREEEGIAQIKEDLLYYFRIRGHGSQIAPLLEDVVELTRRSNENYKAYIERNIAYSRRTTRTLNLLVKLADLEHNSQPDRNRKGQLLSQDDKDRLELYKWAIDRIREEFPDLELKVKKKPRSVRIKLGELNNSNRARYFRKRPGDNSYPGTRDRCLSEHPHHRRAFPNPAIG